MVILNFMIIALITFAAALVQCTSGFGFGMVFMAVIPAIGLIDYKECAVISIIASMVLQFFAIIRLWRHINWKQVLLPVIPAFICGAIGVHVMVGLPQQTIDLILGIFLWALAAYMIFIAPRIVLSRNAATGLTAGAVSGIMGGLFAISGAPIAAYYDAVVDEPLEYQGTIQTFFFITSINLIVNDFLNGNLTVAMGTPTIIAIIACLLGTWVGLKIMQRLSMAGVRRITYCVMLVAGLYYLAKGWL